ncbi:phosphatidylinositol-specific phospholipase C domain-containing protein [Endozoicomonas sp. 2B-B]
MKKTPLKLPLVGLSTVLLSKAASAGWAQEALTLQYNLQKHTPLVQNNIIGTHNSYSSNAYGMNLYENQDMSITAQLNEGARFLELDLWRNTHMEYVSTVLCHNGGRCGIITGDFIYTDNALREIADWARQNRDQVIVIKLEDQMDDDDYHYFAEAIQRTMGDIVYRPERPEGAGGIVYFPSDLTPADMLAKGKQVIFQGYAGASGTPIGRHWIFGTTNPENDGGDVKANRAALLNCSSHSDTRYSLFYDSAAEGDFMFDQFVPNDMIQPLMQCGGSVFGFDWLQHNDPRTTTAIWSWQNNEPNNTGGNEDCAVSGHGGFNDVPCDMSFAYFCSDGSQWKVTSASGNWQQGPAQCQSEFGASFAFDVPRTAKQNKAAISAAQQAGHSEFWLNYSDIDLEGTWLTGADKAYIAKQNSTKALQVTSWNRYSWNYADTGTGGNNNIMIWRAKDIPPGWYRLGDTVGLATSGPYASSYGRKPGSSIIAYDDGSGMLAKPVSYQWRWNDTKTGGDQDVTLWSPVPSAGYTCLGDIAITNHSFNQPSTDMLRCVRNDLLRDGGYMWDWSDGGSGGQYDATAYLNTTKVGLDVNLGLSVNTFDINVIDSNKVLDLTKVHWLAGPEAVIDTPHQAVQPYRELKVMGKCIENGRSGDNGAEVFVWDCHGGAWQTWVYESATGLIRNQHNPDMCLDSRGHTVSGSDIGQWLCEDHINLKWDWQGHTIRPRVAPYLALDLKWGDNINGQPLWLWDADGSAAQTIHWGN